MSDLARSKISMISEISVVQKNIGSPKTRKFRWKYRDIMDILDLGLSYYELSFQLTFNRRHRRSHCAVVTS